MASMYRCRMTSGVPQVEPGVAALAAAPVQAKSRHSTGLYLRMDFAFGVPASCLHLERVRTRCTAIKDRGRCGTEVPPSPALLVTACSHLKGGNNDAISIGGRFSGGGSITTCRRWSWTYGQDSRPSYPRTLSRDRLVPIGGLGMEGTGMEGTA